MVVNPPRVQSASRFPLAHLQLQSEGQLSEKSAPTPGEKCNKNTPILANSNARYIVSMLLAKAINLEENIFVFRFLLYLEFLKLTIKHFFFCIE